AGCNAVIGVACSAILRPSLDFGRPTHIFVVVARPVADGCGRPQGEMRMCISRKPFPAFAAVLLLASCLPGGAPVIAQDARTGEAAPAQGAVSEPATQDAAKLKEAPTASPDQASERKRGTSKRGAKSRSKGTGRALQPGSTAPPKNLKLVGDHWTPYTPPDPESFGAGATLHIIVPGATL